MLYLPFISQYKAFNQLYITNKMVLKVGMPNGSKVVEKRVVYSVIRSNNFGYFSVIAKVLVNILISKRRIEILK